MPYPLLNCLQYAENEDARQYDRRLRGPIDERRELAVNPENGNWRFISYPNQLIVIRSQKLHCYGEHGH